MPVSSSASAVYQPVPPTVTRGLLDFWRLRSLTLQLATATLLLALLVHVATMVTEHWSVDYLGRHSGLFTYLIPGNGSQQMPEDMPSPLVCPVLALISAAILFTTNLLNLMFATRRPDLVLPAVFVFSFIAALMLMTVIVTWSLLHVTAGQRLSWSFILASLVVILDLSGSGLCILDFMGRAAPRRSGTAPELAEESMERTPSRTSEIQNEAIELQDMTSLVRGDEVLDESQDSDDEFELPNDETPD